MVDEEGKPHSRKERSLIPAGRQAKILGWLEAQGSLSVQELQKRLAVSHMTVHRDLTSLERLGAVRKVRGGVILATEAPIVHANREQQCHHCGMLVPFRSEVQLTTSQKRKFSACCPHCGIMMMTQEPEFAYALARDFLHSRMISILEASFLVGSAVQTCCMPSILCFTTADEAVKFQKGFGGQVMEFDHVWTFLLETHLKDHSKD